MSIRDHCWERATPWRSFDVETPRKSATEWRAPSNEWTKYHRALLKLSIGLVAVSLIALPMAAPSIAQDLSGEWQFKRRAREGWHTGKLVIDGDGEVRQTGRSPMQNYAQCGHVVAPGSGKVEIVFTSVKTGRGYSLDHFYCTVQNESALRCFNIDGIGKENDLFVIERIGRMPASPDGQMDGICPARERPQV